MTGVAPLALALQAALPPPRSAHHLAFEPAAGQVLLFGGNGPTGQMRDLWSSDGAAWTLLADSGPPPRDLAVFAPDAVGGIILFGGRNLATRAALGDLWRWYAGRWTRIAAPGPEPRFHHVGAWDSARRRLVVHGGVDFEGGEFSDTWEFDGSSWTRVTREAPPGIIPIHAAWDPEGQTVLMLGVRRGTGGTDQTMSAELWRWSGSEWTRADTAPGPRLSPAQPMAAAPGGGMLLFDGATAQGREHGITWLWRGGAWTLVSESGPESRNGHAMTFDEARQVVVLTGGWRGQATFADTWEWSSAGWVRVSPR